MFAELFAGRTVEAGLLGEHGLREVGVASVKAEAYGVEVAYAGDFD